jgi:hypothetical protein
VAMAGRFWAAPNVLSMGHLAAGGAGPIARAAPALGGLIWRKRLARNA